MRNIIILIKRIKIFSILITTLLFGTSLTYSQGCLEVPKSILNGTNGFSVSGKSANDDMGSKTKSAGDINNDGIDDIMIGAPGVDFGGVNNVGEVYIIFGKAGLAVNTFDVSTLDGMNGFVMRGVNANEKFGDVINTADDFNNDGIDDIIIGYNDSSGKGKAVVFYGKSSGFSAFYNRTDFNSANSVTFTIDLFGVSTPTPIRDVSYAGDINNDGIADIVFNMYGNDKANIFVVFGKAGITDLNVSALNGTNGFYILGFLQLFSGQSSIARNAGDINNDGKDDLIFGFPSYDETGSNNEGRAVVWFGKNTYAANYQLDAMTAGEGFIITNTGQYSSTGISVAAAGDFNNDGIDDVIIGASGKTVNKLSFAGESYIVFGRNTPFPSTFPANSLNISTGIIFQGKEAYDQLGKVVSSLKDINNDGINDIVIASQDGGKANNGAVYIVFGGSTSTGTLNEDMIFGNVGYQVFNDVNSSSYANFGQDTGGIGDFNNDGTNDFIIGSIGNSTFYNYPGMAYVFYGEKLNRLDTESPVITCPVDQELYTNARLPNYISYLSGVSDNCTFNPDLFFTQNPPQGTLFTGDTQVTITVKDKSGNTNFCTFLVKLKTNSAEIDCKTSTFDVNNLNGSNGFSIYGEKASGNTGYSVDTAGDVNGDGISDFIISDRGKDTPFLGPYQNDHRTFEGSSYIVYGATTGFPPNINLGLLNGTNGFIIRNDTDANYLQSGESVSAAGDINGDGIGDFMISAPLKRWTDAVQGATYVVFGNNSSFPAEFFLSGLNGSNGFVIAGTQYYEASGYKIDNIGDFNNDGFDDIAIVGTGKLPICYIIYGKNNGFPALIKGDELNGTNGFIIEGDVTVNKIGISVAGLGDVNGDGISDIALNGTGSGSSKYVIYGKTNFPAVFKITDINGTNGFTVMNSITPFNSNNVAKIGDINGDGLNDIAFDKNLILFGSASFPASIDLNNLNGTNGFSLLHSGYEDEFGEAGDFNKDGFDDYIFIKNKSAYLLYGKSNWSPTVDVDLFTVKDALKITLNNDDYYSVSYAGDVNKDGIDDIVIGSYNSHTFTGNIYDNAGSAFVIFGKKIIADTEKPTITNCPANKVLNIGDVISDYTTAITVTDNCDDKPSVIQNPVSGTIYTGGILQITLTATDASSNFTSCNFSISNTTDTEKPTLTCPGNQQLACGSVVPDYTSLLTVSDNIDTSIDLTQIPGSGSTFYDGMTINFTAKDDAGNESQCSFIVNASGPDTEPPTFTCPTGLKLNCGDVIPNYAEDPIMNLKDNCSKNVQYVMTPKPGTKFYDGISIHIDYSDESGNTNGCTFIINSASQDNIKPVFTTCIGNQTLMCGSIIPDYRTNIVVTDNCDSSPVITQNPSAGTAFADGMTVTITAKDASNNFSTCEFKINASADIIKPSITCPGNQILTFGDVLPDYSGLVIVKDNCDASPIVSQNPAAGTTFTNGMTVVIYAKDASGNEENCSFVITENADTEKPVIACLGNQNVACSTTVIPDYTSMISVTDNKDPNPIIKQNPIAGSVFTDGMTITISATDASNNQAACNFIVNAVDATNPVITCIGNQTLNSGDVLPDYSGLVIVKDNCDASPIVSQNPVAGSAFTNGMTVVIYAKDASGNEESCSFVITENADTEKPVLTCLGNQNMACSTTVIPDYTSMISVTDNKDPNPIIKQSPIAGSVFTDGMTITISATDASSNQSTCKFQLYTDVVLVDAGDDVEINEGESIQINAITSEEGTYEWSPSNGINNAFISNPLFSPAETTTYKVTFKNKEKCEVEDSVVISVIPKEKDETKYGFSPNNDGINDTWIIHDITKYPNNKVSIYNSWGDLVFQTRDYNNTTNVFAGIANKKRNLGADVLPEGTYFFEINPNSKLHHFKKLKGYLVLKR